MAKKMSAAKTVVLALEEEKRFRQKYPDPEKVLNTFMNMRGEISALIKGSDLTRAQVAKQLGMSENLLFGKIKHPHRWTEKELEKLIKLLY